MYVIGDLQFELYTAANGDFCVSVYEYGKEREDYNLGSREKALEFILSYCAYDEEVEE